MNSTAPIFVADDSQDDCHLLQRAFEAAGIQNPLRFVKDGQDLLEALRAEDSRLPCLLLIDLNMPRLGGLETLIALRRDPRFKPIPVLVLSTSSAGVDIQQSYSLGANAVSVKPFEFKKFVEFASLLKRYWLDLAELPGQGP